MESYGLGKDFTSSPFLHISNAIFSVGENCFMQTGDFIYSAQGTYQKLHHISRNNEILLMNFAHYWP
jgi:hypothetical protein